MRWLRNAFAAAGGRRGLVALLALMLAFASERPVIAQAPDCGGPGATPCRRSDDKLPPVPPDPAARLSRASVSASSNEVSFVSVGTSGRFSIRAKSGSGVALRLVDMMTGPGAVEGEAGQRDGRLDVLLDRGVYKLMSFGAKGAEGEARLSLAPFHGVGKPELLRGEADAELGDLEQRSYWMIVGEDGAASVEAVGRALGDLRLWRNGTDLAGLEPKAATVEAEADHPMTRLRLEGAVEPGLYLMTAYGGAPALWADGKPENPFHLRIGPPRLLAGGWFEGAIGPFGSLRFRVPASASYFRLELPEPASGQLSVARGAAPAVASVSRASRDPAVSLTVAAKDDKPAIVEVSGLQGQGFRLRALEPSDSLRIEEPGSYLVAVDVAGEGGDELPATVLLARFAKGKGTVIASKALRIAEGGAWRGKFNLRGPSSLIFEIANSGAVALRTLGPGVRATLEPLLGANAPRADGEIPLQWNVEAGWYRLKLDPVRDAGGVLDLTFGQPGLAPALSLSPVHPTLDFGVQTVEKGAALQIFANSGPNLAIGPRARKLPADLAAGPLILDQPARGEVQGKPAIEAPAPLPPKRPAQAPLGAEKRTPVAAGTAQKANDKRAPKVQTPAPPVAGGPGALVIPLRAPKGGAIAAADVNGRPVAIELTEQGADDKGRTLVATVPASPVDRRVIVTWSKFAPPAAVPSVAAAAAIPVLKPGEAQFFDLARDETRAFRLDVADGGLYRIGTLGRLKTSATIGTSFIPAIDQASDNGPGHNALLQTYLRAGSYRVNIKALESEGHLGLVTERAALNPAGRLAPEQSARAALTEGSGAVFDVEAPETADYRLDLYSLGKDFPARLEEEDGWPLTPPGAVAALERHFDKGRYRLVVPPVEADARVVARMRGTGGVATLQGHGPHPLAFETPQKFQWREPAVGELRKPDQWTFSLNGPAQVTIAVSEGMAGELTKLGAEPTKIGKISFERGFDGGLAQGDYRLDLTAAGRNDRLDYEVALKSAELQPGAPRLVELPASVRFAIGDDRIVTLTSFGAAELTGVLKDADGRILERLSGRIDDWNIALSRRLPAGAYRLDLAAARADAGQASMQAERPDEVNVADESASDESASDQSADETSADEQAAGEPPAEEGDAETASADEAAPNEQTRAKIELDLALPEPVKGPDLDLERVAQVAGRGAYQLALPAIADGALLVVAAQSSADCVLSLERRDPDGMWRAVGFDRGRAPFVAMPGDGKAKQPWRVSVWPVEGAASIAVVARAVDDLAKGATAPTLKAIPIEGMDPPLEAGAVAVPAKSMLILKEAPPGLRQGSAPGRALARAESGVLAPQSERLWFVRRGGGALRLEDVPADAKSLSLALAEGETATLTQPLRGEGSLRVWRAQSSFGQPGLDAGNGMGLAPAGAVAAAIALTGGEPLRVWNAGDAGPLRLGLEAFDLSAQPMVEAEARYAGAIAPGAAQLVRLPSSAKEIEINLGAGAAAFLSAGDRAATIWGGGKPLSRRLAGQWTNVLFANIGAGPAPVSLAANPAPAEKPLAAGDIRKRFFGAAGSLSLRIEANAGDRLVLAGGRGAFIADSGAVLNGASIDLPAPGELIFDHDAGLAAVWIENAHASPWPLPEPQRIPLPAALRLEGQAMTLAFASEAPALVNARSTAPVILALEQSGVRGEPQLYPAGAELHAYVAAGEAKLFVYSPHEGALAGTLELAVSPTIPAAEGVGEPVTLAPGSAVLFAFEAAQATTIGVGVRSDPDSARVRLIDAAGRSLGEGVAQLRRVEPGRYLIEASAPADGPALIVRPAVVGLTQPANGPPPDVAQHYLELVGLKPAGKP